MRPFTTSAILQDAAVATGVGVVMDVSGMVVVGVQVTIATTATITFEADVGGGTMTALPATNLATGAVATTASATGIYLINCAGLSHVQARISAWSSGAVTAVALASSEASASIAGALGAGSTTLTGPLGRAADAASVSVALSTEDVVLLSPGAAGGFTLVASTAAETSHVLKNAAGTLISLVGYNGKTSAQFIQVHNSTTVPADAAVPSYSFTVPASSNFSLDIPISGAPFTTGISVSNSSTQATKTVGSADCWFTAVVK